MATTGASGTAEGECPLCAEPYNAQAHRARVVCAADRGCGTFAMCRLCTFRRTINLDRPFVVDDDTGDFVDLDPTACPQCKRPDAFREDRLPALPEEVKTDVEREARERREDGARREVARAMQRLNDAPRARLEIIHEDTGDEHAVVEVVQHERVKILSGARERNKFRIDRYSPESGMCQYDMDMELYLFSGSTTSVGVPDMLSTSSGVLYYEVELKRSPVRVPWATPKEQFGFALANGMAVTEDHSDTDVGGNGRSWGFDGIRREKLHFERYGEEGMPKSWKDGAVLGIAANLDRGMIAISTNGNWDIGKGHGVKFEDERIKAGVFPCVTARDGMIVCRFGPEFVHAPPPDSIWETWPKFEDIRWSAMPEEARAAAATLGYTRKSWDTDPETPNPIESKSWEELTTDEQHAGNILGYNEHVWAELTALWKEDDGSEESSDDSSIHPFRTYRWEELPLRMKHAMSWEALPEHAKQALETLGYTETSWDNDREGPLDVKPWSELTPDQQEAATVFGYDMETWNEESDDSDDTDESDGSSDDFSDSDSTTFHTTMSDAESSASSVDLERIVR